MIGSRRSPNSVAVLSLVLAVSAFGSQGLEALTGPFGNSDVTGFARPVVQAPEAGQRSTGIDDQRVAIASSPAHRHGRH